MYVLSRKRGERISIGDQIVITRVDSRRIGIEAPKGLPIKKIGPDDRPRRQRRRGKNLTRRAKRP
jgi:hypothetical protein